jgi:hypothetical protein
MYYFMFSDCNSITNLFIFSRWWRRPINNAFFQLGDFSRLFQELKNTDHEEFYHYVRMTPDQFDWLLEKVKPDLLKYSRRRPFPPELRLAVTLG